MRRLIICCVLLCIYHGLRAQEVITIPDRDFTKSDIVLDNDTVLGLDFDPDFFELPPLVPGYKSLGDLSPKEFYAVYLRALNDNFSYSYSGSSNIWWGITTMNEATFNMHFNYQAFSFTGGTYLLKYDNNGKPYMDAGFRTEMAYDVLPWFTIGAYGQFSAMAKSNFRHGSKFDSQMVPFKAFGVSSKIMFNDNFGIGGSMGRQYNPIVKRWENTYGIGPVIEFKRKKKK